MNALIDLIKQERRLTIAPYNTRRVGKWYQVCIGIGNDDVAYLTLDDDALETLTQVDPSLKELIEDLE